MTFLARLVRFLFWLLVVWWSVGLLRRLVGWMLGNRTSTSHETADGSPPVPTPAAARHLVRDPVCGVHVDETLSIPFREGEKLLHFCSIACRDAYAQNAEKHAANG